MEERSRTIPALLLALGLILGGWILGSEIKATRLGDRYVTVKGLVERKVKSDLAIWPLTYKEAGDDLTSLYAKTEADKKTVLQFLDEQGIQSSEIELGIIRVVDTQANEYGGGTRAPHRYIVEQQITVPPRASTRSRLPRRKPCNCCRRALFLAETPARDSPTNSPLSIPSSPT